MPLERDKAFELLENIYLDVWELLDDLRFEYQHSPNTASNSTAFSKKNDTGDWIMSCCPNHPETRASFGISKEPPYHTNCFYCGYLGTVDKAIEIAFGLDDGEGVRRLLADFIVEEKRRPLDVERIIEEGRERLEIPCLDEQALSKFDSSPQDNAWEYTVAMSYLRGRGLSEHTINTYEVKVDLENDCLVFPQRTRTSKLRFLQKRKIGEQYRGVKFINEGSPIKKDILFGLHFINSLRLTPNRIKRVRLVESPIDAMSNYEIGIPSVAQNGKLLFSNQIRELQLAGVEVVDLFYDNDNAGKQATEEAIPKLIKAGISVNQVLYPRQVRHDSDQDSNTLLRQGLLEQTEIVQVSLLGHM